MNKLEFGLKKVDEVEFPTIMKEDGETIAIAPIRNGLNNPQTTDFIRLVVCYNSLIGIENPVKFIKEQKEYN